MPIDFSSVGGTPVQDGSQGAIDFSSVGGKPVAASSQQDSEPTTLSDKLGKVADQPLTSYTEATRAGAASAAQGVVQGVQGIASAVAHPIDTVKSLASAPGNLVDQIKQVPGAIKDINASPDPTYFYGRALGKTVGNLGGQALVAGGTAAAGGAVGNAVKTAKVLRNIPAAISSDTIDTLNTVAQKEGLPQLTAKTARDAAGEMSENFVQRAKANYKVVDDAVGGDLKPVQEKIQSLKTAIRTNRVLNPDLADKLTTQLAEKQQRLTDLIEEAKQQGVPNADDIMKAADKDYSKGMAMKKVTQGIEMTSGRGQMGSHPNPAWYQRKLDSLEMKGTLQKAVGPEATDALIQNAKEGVKRVQTLGMVKKAAIGTAAAAGVGAAGAAGVGAYKLLKGED